MGAPRTPLLRVEWVSSMALWVPFEWSGGQKASFPFFDHMHLEKEKGSWFLYSQFKLQCKVHVQAANYIYRQKQIEWDVGSYMDADGPNYPVGQFQQSLLNLFIFSNHYYFLALENIVVEYT